MTDAQITINHDGTGTVTVGDDTVMITASGAAAARQQATTHVAERAAEIGRALPATATENGRTWPLLIDPDGTVTPRPRDDAPAPPPPYANEPSTSAPEEQGEIGLPWEPPATDPLTNEFPDAQDDLDATRPRVAAAVPSRASAVQSQTAHQHEQQSTARDAVLLGETWNPHTEHQPTPGLDTEPPAHGTASGPVDADPRWAAIAQQPATHGLRGTLNGMGLKLAPAEEELTERREALRQEIAREEEARRADEQLAQEEAVQETRRAAREREAAEKDRAERAVIQTNYDEPKTVLVANRKGGVGKTTAIYLLGATTGRIRGGDVVAWDANETQGTLGFRARKDHHDRSVVDFLEEAATDFTTVEGSKRSTLTRYTRGQGDNQFAVVASDESSERQDLVDGAAFEKVHEILERFYSIILIDTGNNHRVSHFKAALAATDQLVIPVSAGADGVHAAEMVMDNFIGLGYGHLVKNAVILLNDSATRRGDAHNVVAKFENRVRTIIPIPFDPALDHGGEIDFEALQPSTRTAWQEAAAAIAHGLAETKER